MNEITKRFMGSTNIKETPNGTVEKIMDFLTEPESVHAMVLMTEIGQPALSGVVKKLEDKFANSDFPLHHDGEHANSPNRRNVGWMVRFIMREFGYTPKGEEALQSRIGKFSGSEFFRTAAIYEKTIENPNYRLDITIVEN